MENIKINTPLAIEEIDFRIQSINKGGYATILAYKDARVDMNRLDAVYGPEYWQKKYEVIHNNLFCSVGIYNTDINEWIWKQDVGTESNTEKQKGEASDAFKRACFNLGIGRELYDYPLIQVKLNSDEWELKNDKAYPKFGLKLKEWVWTSMFTPQGKLLELTAHDNNSQKRFYFCSVKTKVLTSEEKLNATTDLATLKTAYLNLSKAEQARCTKLTEELKAGFILGISVVAEEVKATKKKTLITA